MKSLLPYLLGAIGGPHGLKCYHSLHRPWTLVVCHSNKRSHVRTFTLTINTFLAQIVKCVWHMTVCADKGAGAAISAGLHPVHPLDLK